MRTVLALVLLAAVLSAAPPPARADNFVFQSANGPLACTPDQQAQLHDVANAVEDLATFTIAKLRAFAGANPPPDDDYLYEAEFWLGDRPDGDPAHPSPDYFEWQDRLEQVADKMSDALTGLQNTQQVVLCSGADDMRCADLSALLTGNVTMENDGSEIDEFSDDANPDDVDAQMGEILVGAYSFKHTYPNGMRDYVMGVCPHFWDLPRDGSYQTRAPVIHHEQTHLFAGLLDLAADGVDCHEKAHSGKPTEISQFTVLNAYTSQFVLGGFDNIRKGGSGHVGLVSISHATDIKGGCSAAGGHGIGAEAAGCALLALAAFGPRRRRHRAA